MNTGFRLKDCRNDRKRYFQTFYEFITLNISEFFLTLEIKFLPKF